MDMELATVTDIIEDKIKVHFNQDDSPSELEYPKLISYVPRVEDKVLMLKTTNSYICLGGIGAAAEGQKEEIHLVGEYKFFAKDKGLLWQGWAKCDGRALNKNDYPKLFDEIGTTFGGSGNNFNLPDTTGRILSDSTGKAFGSKVGEDTVTLTVSQMPKHKHDINTSKDDWPSSGFYNNFVKLAPNTNVVNSDVAIKDAGGGQAHENRQPTLYGGYYYIYTGKE